MDADIELAGLCQSAIDGIVTVAVDGVNLKIADGAYCCLLGPVGLRQDHDPCG